MATRVGIIPVCDDWRLEVQAESGQRRKERLNRNIVFTNFFIIKVSVKGDVLCCFGGNLHKFCNYFHKSENINEKEY